MTGQEDFLSFGIYALGVFAVVGVMLSSYFLGQRHNDRAKSQPYESGIVSTGGARLRFSIHFYLIAVFFVVFDLETVFLVSWSVAVRELGLFGLIQVSVFIAVLLVGLIYLVRTGALDLAPRLRKPGRVSEENVGR
jgi:NADH-quinone oxidoreductase subunit A